MNLTNQELLSELEKRLPFFTEIEMVNLVKLTVTNMPYGFREKGLKYLEEVSPEFHDLAQRGVQQAEKEKINKQVEEIKRVLGYDKGSEKKERLK